MIKLLTGEAHAITWYEGEGKSFLRIADIHHHLRMRAGEIP
jgi:hypothetical protein